jgi:hypothetical protein
MKYVRTHIYIYLHVKCVYIYINILYVSYVLYMYIFPFGEHAILTNRSPGRFRSQSLMNVGLRPMCLFIPHLALLVKYQVLMVKSHSLSATSTFMWTASEIS